MKQTGYKMKEYGIPTKRYCQTLDLKDDPELISEYRKRHTENEAWPEILQGIRSVGILEMEIYILDNRLFMIVETPFDFDGTRLLHGWLLCLARRSGKRICPSFRLPARVQHLPRNGG